MNFKCLFLFFFLFVFFGNINNAEVFNPPPENNLTYFASKNGIKDNAWTFPYMRINPTNNQQIDVIAGQGFIISNDLTTGKPRRESISWGTTTITDNFVSTDIRTFIYVDRSGAILQSNENPITGLKKDIINLGIATHAVPGQIFQVEAIPALSYDIAVKDDNLADSLGLISNNGVVLRSNLNTTWHITTGNIYGSSRNFINDPFYPDIKTNDLISPVIFVVGYRDINSPGAIIISIQATLNTTLYDNNQVLTTIPDDKPWVFSVITFASISQLAIQGLPQQTYRTAEQAYQAMISRNYDDGVEYDINKPIAYVLYKKGCTFIDPSTFSVPHISSTYRLITDTQLSYDFPSTLEQSGTAFIYEPQEDMTNVLVVTGSSFVSANDTEIINVYNGEEYRKIVIEPDICSLKKDSSQVIGSGLQVTIDWQIEVKNHDGMFVTSNEEIITIKRDGFYKIDGRLSWEFQQNIQYDVFIMKNENTTINVICDARGAGLISFFPMDFSSVIFTAVEDDYIWIKVSHSDGAAKDILDLEKTFINIVQIE